MNKNIGIVGLGFVGTAVYEGLKSEHKVFTYDKIKDCNVNSLKELVDSCEYIFVAVPTPMKNTGECDLSILSEVISDISSKSTSRKTIIIKSTSPVGTTENLSHKYNNLDFVFNPEFLTEANFIEDFKNQDFIILGGEKQACNEVKKFFLRSFPNCDYFITNSKTAELVKYTINNFLAIKVSFANEIYSFCDKMEIDYNEMIEIATNDSRLGQSHWSVPGPDGKHGFGGSCFPKDVSSLLYQLSSAKIESFIIKSALKRNTNIDRPERDWELLEGRAVSAVEE